MPRCCACTAENLSVLDTDSVDLTLVLGTLSADLLVDPDPGNQLSVGPAGAFVPPVVGGTFVEGTDCVLISGSGTPVDPFIVSPIIDPDPGNVLSCGPAGLLATGGGSGGSARVLGPFPFSFDTPGLADGVAFYTPTIGDVVIDAWFAIDTAWDGTTPLGDLGTFLGGIGVFGANNMPIDMGLQDSSLGYGMGWLPSYWANSWVGSGTQGGPARITTADPIKVVVSQNGTAGGGSPGSSQGAGAIYLVIATPSLI